MLFGQSPDDVETICRTHSKAKGLVVLGIIVFVDLFACIHARIFSYFEYFVMH